MSTLTSNHQEEENRKTEVNVDGCCEQSRENGVIGKKYGDDWIRWGGLIDDHCGDTR